MRIVADKNIPYLKGVAEYYGDVTYLKGNEFTKENVKDADTLIIRTVTHFGKEILENSKIKLICSATIGYDHIDTAYCDSHGIKWVNAPGCNSGSVQQYIVSALYKLAEKHDFDIADKTIGIVGVGNVGKKIAKACTLLGMKVLLNDPPRQELEGSDSFVSLARIQDEADFITFHTPLIKDGKYPTYHLGNTDFFKNLKKQPFIFNSSRGAIIDTQAIKEAYVNQLIAGMVIDCWEKEPNIDNKYMDMADIATPHIAGYSADGKSNATIMSLQSLANFWNLPKDPISLIKVPDVNNSFINYNELGLQPIRNAVLRTYNPLTDDSSLRSNITDFSSLRSNYPLRREYLAYTIRNSPYSAEVEELKQLGFNIEYAD